MADPRRSTRSITSHCSSGIMASRCPSSVPRWSRARRSTCCSRPGSSASMEKWDVGQRPVSRGGAVRRRSLLHQVHARLELAPRRRPARAAHRQRYVRAPQHGLVDYLRPGHREPKHARLHHDLSHSKPRRREQLRLGISACALRGNGDRRRRDSRAGSQDSVHHQQRDAARTSSGWSSTISRR